MFVCGGVCRILELTDMVKHLRRQNSEKESSLAAMQASLDRMVRPIVGSVCVCVCVFICVDWQQAYSAFFSIVGEGLWANRVACTWQRCVCVVSSV